MTKMCLEQPEMARQFLIDATRAELPEGFDVEKHFNPSYRPWQQRIAVLPDGDLFKSIKKGQASVVTDQIETFDAKGIQLASGERLDADVVITATGFDLSVMGDVAFVVDGQELDWADTVTYRGLMFTGRAEPGLRVRLLPGQLDAAGRPHRRLRVPPAHAHGGDRQVDGRPGARRRRRSCGPWVEPDNFNPGYLTRSMHKMPKQGTEAPWRLEHDYMLEKEILPAADLDDGTLEYR